MARSGWRTQVRRLRGVGAALLVAGAAALAPAGGAAGAGGWLRLQPAAGRPGTVVQVSGMVPGGPTAAQAARNVGLGYATLCWGPCDGSLTMDVTVHWSRKRPGRFQAAFTVPAVPWLTASGPHPLTPGPYAVGLQCIGPALPGCLRLPPALTARFVLQGPAPRTCEPGQSCAWLRVHPAVAPPGAVVHLQGWAPLTPGVGRPLGYALTLAGRGGAPAWVGQVSQSPGGNLSGVLQVPARLPGIGPLRPGPYTLGLAYGFPATAGKGRGAVVRLAAAVLQVRAPLTWADLGPVHALWTARNSQVMAADPRDGRRLAYCAPGGGIALSRDGGRHWSLIPVGTVTRVLGAAGYAPLTVVREPTPRQQGGPPAGEGGPVCSELLWGRGALEAVFPAALRAWGAPPIFEVGLWTADAGRRWQLIPAPRGYRPADFGGLQLQGSAVLALFAAPAAMPQPAGQPVPLRWRWAAEVRRSLMGWGPVALRCTTQGACLRWGPAPNGLGPCAMGGAPQPLLRSADGGRHWTLEPLGVPGSPAPDFCHLAELVALGPGRTLVVAAGGLNPFPVELSTDGGLTWRDVALPSLPAAAASQDVVQSVGLQLLPSGALWTAALEPGRPGQGWHLQGWLLPAGAGRWCAAGPRFPAAGVDPDQVVPLEGRLWWFQTAQGVGGGTPRSAAVGSVPLASLRCAPASAKSGG